jgi:predicted transcriptional regulator
MYSIRGHCDDLWATTEGTEEAKGMTQRELAEKTGISFAYVSKLETGVMPPPRQKSRLTC